MRHHDGGGCLNDEKNSQIGYSGMVRWVQHSKSVPDSALRLPDSPAEWYRSWKPVIGMSVKSSTDSLVPDADPRGDHSIYSALYKPTLRGLTLFELKSWIGRGLVGRMLLPTVGRPKGPLAFLHLGFGKNYFDGWCNADFFAFRPGQKRADWMLDLRYPLNCASNLWDGVFCEHVLEHLHPLDGMALLREIHRVLKPGCFVRIVVPDCDLYLEYSRWFRERWPTRAEAVWALTGTFGHASTWSGELLLRVLAEQGFCGIRKVAFGVGTDMRIVKDSARRRPESLYVEARKAED